MKPRFTSFRKAAFPALIIVPAFFQPVMAGDPIPDRIIHPLADGSVTVTEEFTSDDNTDWTVEADSMAGSNLKVTIVEGAKLTGAPEVDNGIDVITDNYTVGNSGEINVGGIGVLSRTGDTVIKNLTSGKISGGNVGILLSLPEMEIDSRQAAAVSAPFYQITNSGSIHGLLGGISADDGIFLSLENKSGGFISGNAGAGIIASDNLSILNAGGITGGFSLNESLLSILDIGPVEGSNGISAGSDAQIRNSGSIEGLGGHGISSDNRLHLDNSGFISGSAISGGGIMDLNIPAPTGFLPSGYSGILTGDGAEITNRADGVIEGSQSGISGGYSLNLTNRGGVFGGIAEAPVTLNFVSPLNPDVIPTELPSQGYAGVSAQSVEAIENHGTIDGGVVGIEVLDPYENGISWTVGDTIVEEVDPESAKLNIDNKEEGTVTGGVYGIKLGNDFTLQAILEDGEAPGEGLDPDEIPKNTGADQIFTIKNSGTIEGRSAHGIYSFENFKLTNFGEIQGGLNQSGMPALAESEIPDSGVFVWKGADITNKTGAVIQGEENGITAGRDLILKNSGDIIGGQYIETSSLQVRETTEPLVFRGNNGVDSLTGANITNDGLIKGGVSGISIRYDQPSLEMNPFVETRHEKGEITPTSLFSITNNQDAIIEGNTNGILLSQDFRKIRISDDEELVMNGAPFSATITNKGTITGLGPEGYGIRSTGFSTGREMLPTFHVPETVNNYGIIAGQSAAINLGTGADIINLYQGSNIEGDIRGDGETLLNFFDGATSLDSPDNIVNGDVTGIKTITKSGTGFAFIGLPGDEYEVEADFINVTGGGLIINGTLGSMSENGTIINLSGDGQLDGTGEWHADINVGEGVISAGGITNALDEEEQEFLARSARIVDSTVNYSVGSLIINGSVTHNLADLVVKAPSVGFPAVAPLSYIRVDINPQTEINPGTSHDVIYLAGEDSGYDLTGASVILAPTAPKPLSNGKYTIIDGVNPLIGFNEDIPLGLLLRDFNGSGPTTITFDSVLTNYFAVLGTEDPAAIELRATALVEGSPSGVLAVSSPFDTDLVVLITRDYENLPGLSRNQSALGAAIDDLVGNGDPAVDAFIANLDASNLATVQDTLTLLDPSSSFGLVSSQVNTNYRLHRLTENHLAGIRGSSTQGSSVAPSSKDAKGSIVAGPSSTLTSGRGNAWGSFSYDDQDYDGSPGGSDYDGDTGSFTAGVDWLVAPGLVVGVVFDGSKSDYNGEGYDSEVDSFRGAVYGTWGNAMGFYSDALIGFGTADFESRLGSSGILTGNVSNDTSADSFQALWTAGYAMGTRQLKHGPFAGFEYQTFSVDGYSQGGPLDIEVDDYDVDSLRALIGYRVDADLGKFSPYASVAYAHEFEDGENTTTATVGGAPFEVAGAEQGSAVLLSVGTSVALTKSLSLDVSYRGEIALDDGISSNGVSLGLNYNF